MNESQAMRADLAEELGLDPIEMYVRFGRKPVNLFVQLLLVVFTTMVAINISVTYNANERAQLHQFQKILLDSKDQNNIHLLTVKHFTSHLNKIQTFFNQKKSSSFFQNCNLSAVKAQFFISYQQKNDQQKNVIEVDFSSDMMGPFNLKEDREVKTVVQKMEWAKLQINDVELRLFDKEREYINKWSISIQYFLVNKGSVEGRVSAQRQSRVEIRQKDTFLNLKYKFIYLGFHQISISIYIILLAGWSLVLNIKHVFYTIDVFASFRMHSQCNRQCPLSPDLDTIKQKTLQDVLMSSKPWGSLTIKEKLLLFDSWLIVSVAANLIQMQSCVVFLLACYNYKSKEGDRYEEKLMGLSVFLSYLSCLKYLSIFQKGRDKIAQTMSGAGRWLLRFIIGFSPILFAYVFTGMCLFSQYSHFSSFSRAISTLFSLMVADSVQMITQDMIQQNPLTQIYLFSYIFIFFIIVHSITVALIIDKFKMVTSKSKKESKDQSECQSNISRQLSQESNVKSEISYHVLKSPVKPIVYSQVKRMSRLLNDTIKLDNESSFSKLPQLNDLQKQNEIISLSKILDSQKSKKTILQMNSKNINMLNQDSESLSRSYQKIYEVFKKFNFNFDNVNRTINDKLEFYDLTKNSYSNLLILYKKYLNYVHNKLRDLEKGIVKKCNYIKYLQLRSLK